jgi:hypothetical protein
MKYNDTATDVLTERPTCDICRSRPAAIDGATKMGPWAYMCVPCFEVHGIGLGLGRGQRLLIDSPTTHKE